MKGLNAIGYGVNFFKIVFGTTIAVVLTPESDPAVCTRIEEKAGAVVGSLNSQVFDAIGRSSL